METIKEIASVSEFVFQISKLENCYFRGESEKFKQANTASGYRYLENNDFRLLIQSREKLYQEIGYSLDNKEIENFIAYCQHHGLPTELLDITENPLVALYFACSEKFSKEGFVYGIENKNTFELKNSLINQDILKQNFNFDNYLKKIFLKQVDDFFDIGVMGEEVIGSSEELFEYIRNNVPDDKDFFINTLKKYNDWVDYEDQNFDNRLQEAQTVSDTMWTEIFKTNWDIQNLEKTNSDWDWDSVAMNISIENGVHKCLAEFAFEIFLNDSSLEIPPIKYLIHQPSVIFDRMRNQQGKFIYQNHMIDFEGKMRVQKIHPDYIFNIPACRKMEILKQLDYIGINKKFIYPDHDHIAEYVKDKYLVVKN